MVQLIKDKKGFVKLSQGGEFNLFYKNKTFYIENIDGEEIFKTSKQALAYNKFFELEGLAALAYGVDGDKVKPSNEALDQYSSDDSSDVRKSLGTLNKFESIRQNAIRSRPEIANKFQRGWRLIKMTRTSYDENDEKQIDRFDYAIGTSYNNDYWQVFLPKSNRIVRIERDSFKVIV